MGFVGGTKNRKTAKIFQNRDVGRISDFGGTTLQGHSFVKKEGAFSKYKGHFFVYYNIMGARAPSAPAPTSMEVSSIGGL